MQRLLVKLFKSASVKELGNEIHGTAFKAAASGYVSVEEKNHAPFRLALLPPMYCGPLSMSQVPVWSGVPPPQVQPLGPSNAASLLPRVLGIMYLSEPTFIVPSVARTSSRKPLAEFSAWGTYASSTKM